MLSIQRPTGSKKTRSWQAFLHALEGQKIIAMGDITSRPVRTEVKRSIENHFLAINSKIDGKQKTLSPQPFLLALEGRNIIAMGDSPSVMHCRS
ncbi:MAG: hypothetical protein H7Y31_11750 [Chitinophagaceae bacterium]|nr:hypothetical protein [Chitinophagaceae bacterium]